MTLDEIPDGSNLFIDANIFIYAVGRQSEQCRRFLRRCAGHEITGRTTTGVIAEVCHRRMLMEARAKGVVPRGGTPRDLARKKALFVRLTDYQMEIRSLLASEVRVDPVLGEDFPVALMLEKQFGLLTNDSLNLAVAKRLGLGAIASADGDFEGVEGFMIYGPDDLPV